MVAKDKSFHPEGALKPEFQTLFPPYYRLKRSMEKFTLNGIRQRQ